MESILDVHKPSFEKSLEALNNELAMLRIGRANPLIVENILIEAYGTKTALKQLSSITVPEARSLLIQPWDKTICKDIEKSIIQANIGLNPVNEGHQIRLTVPPLTEESRKELTKAVGEKMEKSRIVMRQIRDKVREEILKKEKNKEITEDDRFDSLKKLDDLVKNYNEKIRELGEKKEKDIMSI